MSMKDRLSRKTEGLVVPTKSETAAAQPNALRTSPGQMLMVNSLMKESNERMALLEERLKEYEGVLPVKLLDAEKIVPSRWANRLVDSFQSPEFAQLKQEIASSGGNVQPIKVRRSSGNDDTYEIVFGHRRHRACAELGLPVLAMVEDIDDQQLFKEMDRENRERADLSPWEQGMMYRRALDEKLFKSQEQLSKELGVDPGNVSKALKLADLDYRIVQAFSSPLDLQYRWAKPLSEALINGKERVLSIAAELIKGGRAGKSAKDIFELLTSSSPLAGEAYPVMVNGKVVATIVVKGSEVTVRFGKGAAPLDRIADLEHLIADWMSGAF
ncbi:chromosome partitioning protein, ParB family [Noviherbaspirillum humi]|uniref:Chromosome partitioning protein, ParB family n=1 Tax=Noviherbaspirillum humi TaxID=1688639 RepID=A0A239M383_9BURK|nr:ParB/RepB/Spo0J family partition protein [Noviherbaspirillum humi]SNT37091.1 chromosome partitioning protein, ParB family [Noviherbaspirillum humi]